MTLHSDHIHATVNSQNGGKPIEKVSFQKLLQDELCYMLTVNAYIE